MSLDDPHEQRRDLTDEYRDLEIRLTGVWQADEQAYLKNEMKMLTDKIYRLTAKIDAQENV